MELKKLLSEFISLHTEVSNPIFDDEIVNYLSNLIENCDYEDVDKTEFLTMCEAYIPQLSMISKDSFFDWFSSLYHKENHISNGKSDPAAISSRALNVTSQLCAYCETDCSSVEINESLHKIITVLPDVCKKLLLDCLKLTNEDVDNAIIMAIDRCNCDGNLNSNNKISNNGENNHKLSNEERKAILNRYTSIGYSSKNPNVSVPTEYDKPQSRLRYVDGKLVNTNGKNYIEIEREYPNMPKATFLKAARRYKFH